MFIPAAGSFSDYDVKAARTMPSGSFERITFRLAVLHELEFQRSGEKTVLGSPSGQGRTPLVVNPPRALELAIDKFATLSRVVTLGYQVPETIVAQDRNEALEAFKQLGGDCVVKPVFGGEGRGVMRVQEEELAWYAFSTLEQVDALFYIQKFYPPGGMDIRLLVIGSRVIGVRRTNPNDFRTNRAGGGKSEAFVVTDDLRELAVNICQDLGLVYGAVDLLENEHGETKVVEVNAIPGWKGAAKGHTLFHSGGDHHHGCRSGGAGRRGMKKAFEPNVAARLKTIATLMPSGVAIAEPDGPVQADGTRSYRVVTFGALDRRTDEIARGLLEWGVQPGMRLVMLVPFSGQFIELVLAPQGGW